ncbi:MAG: metal-sulfur cluster assembly factor [Lactobacillaceae bacterium]|jgi:metal-sulfur cluster biosynthetic enzyme|nr:metal-sulfur cluster assembly factor [Lactobacillaceae bacterium]
MADTVKTIWAMLETVEDPELRVDVVNLGLIYGVELVATTAKITMTWTMLGCPLGDLLERRIVQAVETIDGVDEVEVELVWEPAWNKDKMTPFAKMLLGIR